jgi:hypothetical protein
LAVSTSLAALLNAGLLMAGLMRAGAWGLGRAGGAWGPGRTGWRLMAAMLALTVPRIDLDRPGQPAGAACRQRAGAVRRAAWSGVVLLACGLRPRQFMRRRNNEHHFRRRWQHGWRLISDTAGRADLGSGGCTDRSRTDGTDHRATLWRLARRDHPATRRASL